MAKHLAPGLFDIHCHGGGGVSFGDSPAAIPRVIAAHRQAGTSYLIASLVSAPLPVLEQQIAQLVIASARYPELLGIHLEGPFLAPSRKGAHDPAALAVPTPAAVAALLTAGGGFIKQITIAPELPGALEAISDFVSAGMRVAIGHTEANDKQVAAAFDAGASLLTHAGNAMPPLAARNLGPVGLALQDDRITLELIADGVHTSLAYLELLFEHAPGRVALVTDAMAGAAAPSGAYRLGALDVTVAEGKAVITGTDTLAGSVLTLRHAVAVVESIGIPRTAALAAASTVPARALGFELAAPTAL